MKKLEIIKSEFPEEERTKFIQTAPGGTASTLSNLPTEIINYKVSKGLEVSKQISRFKQQSGKPPHYPHTEAEAERKLLRQFEEIRSHSEQFKQVKDDLHIEITNWITSAKKFNTEEVYKLREEAENMLKEI